MKYKSSKGLLNSARKRGGFVDTEIWKKVLEIVFHRVLCMFISAYIKFNKEGY